MSRPVLLASVLAAASVHAQTAPPAAASSQPSPTSRSSGKDVTELSLEDLLNTPVTAATQQARPLREVPGVITVVTREEILNSGARDMIDVLRLVPGFEFAGYVDDQVVPIFRGGGSLAVLLMIDGIDMSDHLFSTLYMGNHYPIDNIDHIEIIRGAGSVIYGGAAEYAVVNIITRNGAALNGVSVSGIYGQQSRGLDRRNLNLSYGQRFDNGLDLSGSILVGEGNRSDRTYSDFFGNSAVLSDNGNATLNPLFVNLAGSYKGLKVRLIYDNFAAHDVDASGFNWLDASGNPAPVPQTFTAFFGDVQYETTVFDRLTITPRITYSWQSPWTVADTTSPGFFDQQTARWQGRLNLSYLVTEGLRLNLGFDGYAEHAWVIHPELAGTGYQTLLAGSPTASHQDAAVFGEVAWDSPWVNLYAGARFEHHSVLGDTLVPRLAATKVLGRFHAKLLYSQSFRAAGFDEIALSNPAVPLRPEHVSLAEAEVGYQFTDSLFARANVFNLIQTDSLTYVSDPVTLIQYYANYKQTGSRGVEAEIRAKNWLGYLTLTYSFYTAGGINQADLFAVPGQPSALLAAPQHKFTANGSLNLGAGFTLNPSLIVLSGRWAYITQDGTNTGVGVLGQTPTSVLLNFFVWYRPPRIKGLEVGAGIYNLFDDSYAFVQPFNDSHASLPGPARDFVIRAAYTFGL